MIRQLLLATTTLLPMAVAADPVTTAVAPEVPRMSWHRVDTGAFTDKPAYDRKKGTVIMPAMVRTIVPGMNKDAVYRIVGTPQFGEMISRKFDYVLYFAQPGAERMRCRMRVVFAKPEHQPITSDHTAVKEVLWQTQACADRAARG